MELNPLNDTTEGTIMQDELHVWRVKMFEF